MLVQPALHVLWQASKPDELDMEENEELEIIANGEGDGWVRVRRTLTCNYSLRSLILAVSGQERKEGPALVFVLFFLKI